MAKELKQKSLTETWCTLWRPHSFPPLFGRHGEGVDLAVGHHVRVAGASGGFDFSDVGVAQQRLSTGDSIGRAENLGVS
jgi:hypothetical protein